MCWKGKLGAGKKKKVILEFSLCFRIQFRFSWRNFSRNHWGEWSPDQSILYEHHKFHALQWIKIQWIKYKWIKIPSQTFSNLPKPSQTFRSQTFPHFPSFVSQLSGWCTQGSISWVKGDGDLWVVEWAFWSETRIEKCRCSD